nr:glutamyl-tRNA(Gln) amidotransferase subunit A, chloroplastic/mitochondrial [Ipomoea batatas]
MMQQVASKREIPDFTSQDNLESKPLKGLRVGVIRETIEEGVDLASHLEELGCTVCDRGLFAIFLSWITSLLHTCII